MREPLIFSINYTAYSKVMVTSEWLIRISNYNVLFAQISDSRFFVVNSNDHPYLSNEMNGIQLIDIRVESISGVFKPFFIRVNSQEMLDNLRDTLGRPIEISESLTLAQPLHDRFVVEFVKLVKSNPKYKCENKESLDPCLGCSSTTSEVKINKTCVDSLILAADEGERRCQSCSCRPMWCARCMGRIFASKQNQQTPEIWMAGRAPCPTCRATFCALDVCFLE
uniref:E3 ubiquitin-protein ligase TM129 n=1 Tax=Ditylenchus dipsaci TaxID=166011 RepID=A0A915EFN6_9BILA